MRFLRVIYVMGIAALIIALVISGVEAFYPAPQYPYCPELLGPAPDYDSPEYEEWQQECTQIRDVYRQEVAARQKNIFIIVLPVGAVFAVGGTFLRRRQDIFGAGLILGGMGTMVFAIVPYDLDNILRFAGIAVALAVLIFIGYKVFFSLRRS
jgi:hypothetical protein